MSPVTVSPARSMNHGTVNSPMSGHRSVLGNKGRYLEKASSDTSAVLSPRLLLAAAGLGHGPVKDNVKVQSTKSSHCSTSNILSSNMVPLHIRRLTRRASSGGGSGSTQEKTSASSPLIASSSSNVKNTSSISNKIKSHTNILLSPLINSSHRASSGPSILSNDNKDTSTKYQIHSSDSPDSSKAGNIGLDSHLSEKIDQTNSFTEDNCYSIDVDVELSGEITSVDDGEETICTMAASLSRENLIPPATVSSASSNVTIESTSTVLTE